MEGLHKKKTKKNSVTLRTSTEVAQTAVSTSVYLWTSTNNLWMKLLHPNSNWE